MKIIILSGILIFSLLWRANAYDEEAAAIEQFKPLTPFSLEPYIAEVDAMNYQDPDEIDQLLNIGPSFSFFLNEEREETESSLTRDEKNKRQDLERSEKESRLELKFQYDIKRFFLLNPIDKTNVEEILRTISPTCNSWASFATHIGDYFRKQKLYSQADYFYDLAISESFETGDQYAASNKGLMYLDRYNEELNYYSHQLGVVRYQNITSSMFHSLQKTISAFSLASVCYEVADFALVGLKQRLYQFVRWHISTQQIVHDHYYRPGALVRRVYDFKLVPTLLRQSHSLQTLTEATQYDGSLTSNDLLKLLKDLGFYGIFQAHNQHNWVNKLGLMVRIKRIDQNKAQFTIGITLKNPIVWKSDGKPERLETCSDGSSIAFDENNEVFKIALRQGALNIIPAFYEKQSGWLPYWYRSNFVEMMRDAHFDLPDGFGGKAPPFNLARMERFLTF